MRHDDYGDVFLSPESAIGALEHLEDIETGDAGALYDEDFEVRQFLAREFGL
jgi:hypothetical protein